MKVSIQIIASAKQDLHSRHSMRLVALWTSLAKKSYAALRRRGPSGSFLEFLDNFSRESPPLSFLFMSELYLCASAATHLPSPESLRRGGLRPFYWQHSAQLAHELRRVRAVPPIKASTFSIASATNQVM